MDSRLIDFFKVALVESNFAWDPKLMNQRAMKLGYIIHPECCTDSVSIWLDEQEVNYNATFYKTWEDITSRSRLELAVDQLISYAINYGLGGNFDMNDKDYSLVPDICSYKVIMPVTVEELYNKCLDVLFSGIALKHSTMKALCDFIIKHRGEFAESGFTLDFAIDDIKNKEAQTYLCDKLNICPNEKFALLRYIVYKVTGETQIVKDKYIMTRIQYGRSFSLNRLTQKQLEGLASIFHRYKPVFLGLKKQDLPEQKSVVNKIRRMADKLHAPLQPGFWETIVDVPVAPSILVEHLDEVSNFKLIRLIQVVRENQLRYQSEDKFAMYPIRNGNVYFKKTEMQPDDDWRLEWWNILEKIFYNVLVERLKQKVCTVKFPAELNLTCPTSEKTFIGNFPFGTSYTMTNNNMFGIYWKETWGTRDFDLSFLTYGGVKIGWNGDFNTGDVIYSGDMTHANPEASEVIYMRNTCPDGMIKVNRYFGTEGSKFKLMVAQDSLSELPRNYMIDPNTIKFQTECESIKAESFVGFVNSGTLYLCDFQMADCNVSRLMTADDYGKVLARKAQSFVNLKQLLLDAGFMDYDEVIKDAEFEPEVGLDLTNLNKDTLIELFS